MNHLQTKQPAASLRQYLLSWVPYTVSEHVLDRWYGVC